MIKIFLILTILIYLVSCASSSKIQTGTDSGDRKPSGKYDESFDPMTLDDDDIVINKEENDSQIKQPEEKTSIDQDTKKVVDRFSDHGYKVYLIYEDPLYRLRIGDAITRKDADIIRDLAKERGYDEAFIVRSKVMAPESEDTSSGL